MVLTEVEQSVVLVVFQVLILIQVDSSHEDVDVQMMKMSHCCSGSFDCEELESHLDHLDLETVSVLDQTWN